MWEGWGVGVEGAQESFRWGRRRVGVVRLQIMECDHIGCYCGVRKERKRCCYRFNVFCFVLGRESGARCLMAGTVNTERCDGECRAARAFARAFSG